MKAEEKKEESDEEQEKPEETSQDDAPRLCGCSPLGCSWLRPVQDIPLAVPPAEAASASAEAISRKESQAILFSMILLSGFVDHSVRQDT